MSTKPNYTVTGSDWIDLFSVLSIPNGSTVQIQNLGVSQVITHEAASKPAANVLDGPRIRSFGNGEDSTAILKHDGSNKIWIRTINANLTTTIAITFQ